MCIVRHKISNVLYEYLGEDRYRNVVTDIEGYVSPETAQKIFAINLDATELINKYPTIEKLIKKLDLKIFGNNFQ